MNLRLIVNCVFIALPALALAALGGYFLAVRVPQIEQTQKSVRTRALRAAALEMLADDSLATQHGPRQKGWRQTSKIDRRVPWGHVPCEGGERVWVGADAACVAQRVIPPSEFLDIAGLFQVGVPVVIACFFALTGMGIWYFVRYSKERDDFLSATAHDLTTPLVAMRRLIGNDNDYALVLNERMVRLVKNIVDFLRLGGKRRPPEVEDFTIGSAFYEAYHLFADDFADEASGPVTIAGDMGLCVRADRMLTVQILWNILGNNLKYAAPHGPIRVRVTETPSAVDVAFVDAGPGMTARQRRRAFDRYYRARTVLATGKGGFGIGLCTSRELARAMGGELSVGANDPHGCVFTLRLPKGE